MSSHIGYITIDINDMPRAIEFWKAALNAIAESGSDTFKKLELEKSALDIFLQLVPEPKASKSRMHLDLVADDVDAEVARLTKLGAKVARPLPKDGFRFAVLQDPFGNEFCVLPA